jgi:predicted transcriptional regulator
MGLIAQNMGRNPNDIETYLKNFDAQNIIDANKKSLTIGQDTYQETRKNKLTNKEQREVFQDKEEENRILKDLGFRSIKEYDEQIKDKFEELRKNLTERFGDDINAKIEYLKKNIKIDDK